MTDKKRSMEDCVKEIISFYLATDESQIIPSANLISDLGIDSLDCVELIIAFEEEFAIAISAEEADRCNTVQDCISLIHSKIV